MKSVEIVYYLDRILKPSLGLPKNNFESDYCIKTEFKNAILIKIQNKSILLVYDLYGKYKIIQNPFKYRILKMPDKQIKELSEKEKMFYKLFETINNMTEKEILINF